MAEQEARLEAPHPLPGVAEACAAFAGAMSAMHKNLGHLQGKVETQTAVGDARRAQAIGAEVTRDIDSARVYLEAAFWKMETILDTVDRAHLVARAQTPEPGPYDDKTIAEIVHDYAVIRGDLSEQYARDQLVHLIEQRIDQARGADRD